VCARGSHLATMTVRPPSEGRISAQVMVPSGSTVGDPRPRVREVMSSLLIGDTQSPGAAFEKRAGEGAGRPINGAWLMFNRGNRRWQRARCKGFGGGESGRRGGAKDALRVSGDRCLARYWELLAHMQLLCGAMCVARD
jgi:hypothetical protein